MGDVLFIVNDIKFFLSHRLTLAHEAAERGFNVIVATGSPEGSALLAPYNIKHRLLPMGRSSTGLLEELSTAFAIWRLLRKIKPHIIHLVTIKPAIYGGIAARLFRSVEVVAAISGMGTVFVSVGMRAFLRRALVRYLYRLALGGSRVSFIFQNEDDRDAFRRILGHEPRNVVVLPGSGVSLDTCRYLPEPEETPVVCMAARLLKDKGVVEYVEAARILRERSVAANFILAGAPDPGNPTSISEAQVAAWAHEGMVELPGFVTDVPALYGRSHIVCLPSYREGFPKSLLEAAACGRAIVTTDVPGCRDAVVPGDTGLLVPARDPVALADALQRLIQDEALRKRMGQRARRLAEQKFGIEGVVEQHMALYKRLLDKEGA